MTVKYTQAQEKVIKRIRSLVEDSRRMEKWVPLAAPIVKAALERAVSEVGEPPSGTVGGDTGPGIEGPLVETDSGLRVYHPTLTVLSNDGMIGFDYTPIKNYTVVDAHGVLIEFEMLPVTI